MHSLKRVEELRQRASIYKDYLACPDCDLLLPQGQPHQGHVLRCPRCNKIVHKHISNSIEKTTALSLAGLLLYLPAIFLPLMTLKSYGFSDSANIIETTINLLIDDYYFVSLMVMLSAVVFPLVLLFSIFWVSLQLKIGKSSPYLKRLFRLYLHLEEWAMVEVYLLGILITIIKMHDSSQITYHYGIFCFFTLVVLTLAISTVLNRTLFWSLLDAPTGKGQEEQQLHLNTVGDTPSASGCGLISCHTCHLLADNSLNNKPCPRCGEVLHQRKMHSIARTWALVITSAILLVPANVLPIMQVDFLGIPEKSTIMDGIIYFFQDGDYPIGLIIFAASILVPVFKIVGLVILLLATRPCDTRPLKNKTKMYRCIAFIGRWSMLDIFVIALLTTIVDFGFLTSIHTAPAATYFCIVVASTMFAAITFDPRIMWDKCRVAATKTTIRNNNSTHATTS